MHSDELSNLYSSSNIIRMAKSRRMGQVSRLRKIKNAPKIRLFSRKGVDEKT
jgi:hypothetical protein